MINFIPLVDESQLVEINDLSNKPRSYGVLLFKHSTRCGVSIYALKQLEREYKFTSEEMPVYLLDILNYRQLSNRIAELYGVAHESPQILFIKDGKCSGNASHNNVSNQTINGWINE